MSEKEKDDKDKDKDKDEDIEIISFDQITEGKTIKDKEDKDKK